MLSDKQFKEVVLSINAYTAAAVFIYIVAILALLREHWILFGFATSAGIYASYRAGQVYKKLNEHHKSQTRAITLLTRQLESDTLQ